MYVCVWCTCPGGGGGGGGGVKQVYITESCPITVACLPGGGGGGGFGGEAKLLIFRTYVQV